MDGLRISIRKFGTFGYIDTISWFLLVDDR